MATSPYLNLRESTAGNHTQAIKVYVPNVSGGRGIVTNESEAHVRTPGSDLDLSRSQKVQRVQEELHATLIDCAIRCGVVGLGKAG